MYGTPLLAQVLLRGTTMWGILGAYVVAFAAVAYAIALVDGHLQMYTLLWGPLIFVFISYEIERMMRVAFVRNALLLDGRQALVQSTVLEANLKHKMANEQHLARKEEELLRSVMGNVAHDMKTPLHSISAEVECIVEAVTDGFQGLARHGDEVARIASHVKSKVCRPPTRPHFWCFTLTLGVSRSNHVHV
jgi:signal transduction histidine kinase